MSSTREANATAVRATGRRARRALAGAAVTAVVGITALAAADSALADPALALTPNMECGYNTLTADKLDFNENIGTLSWIPQMQVWDAATQSWDLSVQAAEQTIDTSATFGGLFGFNDQLFTGLTPGYYYRVVDFTSVNGSAWAGVAAQAISVTAGGVVAYCHAG